MISTCNICEKIFDTNELVDVGFMKGYECESCNGTTE